MLFQQTVEARLKDPVPGQEGFEPREEEIDYNHLEGGY